MWFFTSDQHYGHSNIIKYTNRPFKNVDEMNNTLITNFNSKVTKHDITVHAGDFAFKSNTYAQDIINQLNGNHIFIKGNHDKWFKNNKLLLWEKYIDKKHFVVCHYAMRTWNRSCHNSIHLYGHSHGMLPDMKNRSMDIGVDTNNYFPYSINEILEVMKNRTNNNNSYMR